MALTAYITATQNLLQNPTAPSSLYATTSLITYINTARSQLAAESECIRIYVQGTTTPFANVFPMTSISLTGLSAVASVLNVRMISTGTQLLNTHPWEWFNLYFNNANPAIAPGYPTDWAQFGQGVGGNIFFSPTPNNTITLNFDCVGLPIPLVDDTTAEAIPYPWTDAVPFFAAFYALLSAQAPARNAEADKMFQRYEMFKERARRFVNPSVENYQYLQAGPPIRNTPIDAATGAQIAGKGGG